MEDSEHKANKAEESLTEQPTPSPSDPPESASPSGIALSPPGKPPKRNKAKTHKALGRDRWVVVRKAYVEGNVSQGDLATMMGVGESTVQDQCDRGGWTGARKERTAEQRALAMKGVDQAALAKQKAHEEALTSVRDEALQTALKMVKMLSAPMAVYTELYNAQEARRRKAREAEEDDPGPLRTACPVKASDVNALAQAVDRFLDYELKLAGEPGVRVRHEVVSVDVTELARAIIKG